jgi:hypothetical protein
LQGGLTPIDVFSVEWIQSGTMHYGTTVSYFGFVSDGKNSTCQTFYLSWFFKLAFELALGNFLVFLQFKK